MIYQELSLAAHLNVEENILLGMEPCRLGFIQKKRVREKALEALRHFDHPEITPKTRVADLTVSAQQLVEIARSLAVGCKVLVFDEPTSSLGQRDIDRLFEIIRLLKKQGISIVYISHFLDEVEQVADRLTVLRDGSVQGTRRTDDLSTKEIVEMMVGRQVEELYPRTSRIQGEPVLEVEGLAGRKKPEHAGLTLHRGEVLGICGLVGAGRTELFRTLFGLDQVVKGKIRLGIYSGQASPYHRWRQGMGFLSENRKEEGLALSMSLADNVTLSKMRGYGRFGLVLPGRQQEATRKWIQNLDIRCRDPGQPIQDLSGGNQQKAALARLLEHDVDVLLLDEPTRGIDVAAKAKIYEMIDILASGPAPKAILMISSYLPELLGVCDRIAVMYRGRLGKARPVGEVDESRLMMEATGQGVIG
jgi:ribose transport system ATP-binding protein